MDNTLWIRETLGILTLMLLLQTHARADLIAQYNFDDFTADDSSGSSTVYNLSAIGDPTPDFTGGVYHSDGIAPNYLHVDGPGALSDFTVSVWVTTNTVNQGTFFGIFSSDNTASLVDTFQLDSTDGNYSFTRDIAERQTPTQAGVWQNLVLQKLGGNDAIFFADGVQIGANIGEDPGELFDFVLGRNRFENKSFTGQIDNVQIWDDSQQSAAAIFALGREPSAVPEPTSFALFGLGAIGLISYRRRRL